MATGADVFRAPLSRVGGRGEIPTNFSPFNRRFHAFVGKRRGATVADKIRM